jgi:hypothetical protein
MSDPERASLSVHEMRRRAPLHYWAKAANAWFTAYVLDHSAERAKKAKEETAHGGNPGIAMGEAYWREAALALELITKALIARRIELGKAPAALLSVPMTHDLPKLRMKAALPRLTLKDQERLLFAKKLLFWASRYAAPRTDEAAAREREEETALRNRQTKGPLPILMRIRPIEDRLSWDDFDRLYRIAITEFDMLETEGRRRCT